MESLDQITHTKSYNDVDSRRLKNRERQRRYRARKRLEAHSQEASVTNLSTQLSVQKQLNGNFTNCTPPVQCKRNWKKDARLAHALKAQAAACHGPVISSPAIANDSKVTCLPFGVTAEPLLDSKLHEKNPPTSLFETTSTTHGRRDWKADARNKNKCEMEIKNTLIS